MKLRFVATVALLSLAVALLGACGSSGSGSEEEGAANQPSTGAEQDDQSDAEATQVAEEEDEEEPSSACLEAKPSKTKFTVLAVDKAGFGYFKPKKLEVPAGEEITIIYENETATNHDFVIDSLGCDTGVVDKAAVTFTAPSKPAEFRCTIHEFMTGKLIPIG